VGRGNGIVRSMSRRYVVIVGVVLAGLTAGCSEPPYPLADRSTPAVRDEERRITTVLRNDARWAGSTCRVRLLGREGSSSFAWADCETPATAGTPAGGESLPLAVDGEKVTSPADGAGYADSVRRMFPPRLADKVLSDPESLRP
jgi:hypothetical protein